MASWLRYWIPNLGSPCSKPLGDSKLDSVSHPSKVNKMSTRNFRQNYRPVQKYRPESSLNQSLFTGRPLTQAIHLPVRENNFQNSFHNTRQQQQYQKVFWVYLFGNKSNSSVNMECGSLVLREELKLKKVTWGLIFFSKGAGRTGRGGGRGTGNC